MQNKKNIHLLNKAENVLLFCLSFIIFFFICHVYKSVCVL